jgi:hypothetical protein
MQIEQLLSYSTSAQLAKEALLNLARGKALSTFLDSLPLAGSYS